MTFDWKIEVRNSALERIGEVDDYQSLDLTLKFNDVSTWQLKVDRRSRLAVELSQPGAGIVVSRGGTTILSGDWREQEQRKDDNSNQLELSGVDDTVWLKRRVAHPQPLSSNPPYSTTAEDVRTNLASNVMRQFVAVNVSQDGGTPAIPPRIKAGLTRQADVAYGPTITGRGRWQNLLTLLQELAIQGAVGGIPVGFRIAQVGTGLQYQNYVPVDRTATVVFSEGFGNLAGFSYKRTAPDGNFWYVGGQGEGTARTIFEHTDSASVALWGRAEGEFVDARSAANAGELAQAAEKAKADDAEKHSLSITPIDTPQLAYGVHYGLGDRVTAVLDVLGPDAAGAASDMVQDVIRECKIQLQPDRVTITPAVGNEGTAVEPVRLFQRIKGLVYRMNNLERR